MGNSLNGVAPMLPPMVSGSPLVGSALDLRRDVLGACERARAEYGDAVRFRVGPPGLGRELYLLFHPDAARRVLAEAADDYRKDNAFNTEIRRVFGGGLLTSQDVEWRRQKQSLQPLFTARRVANYAETIGGVVEEHARRWRTAGPSRVELHEDMTRLTLRIVGRVLFGEDLHEALPIIQRAAPLGRAVNRRAMSPLRLPLGVPTPTNLAVVAHRRALHRICSVLVERRRGGPNPREDLLDLLLQARVDGEPLTDAQVRDQVLVFLLAGHETTATALAAALRLLGSRGEVQRRVREEVEAVVGTAMPRAEDAAALTYTTMVVKEVLRLYPSAPFIGRRAVRADRLGGYAIPAGAQVALSPWITHRDPRFWNDPGRFEPQRFAPERERARHRYAWFPFGGGPRACIGQRLALLEVVIALAMLVRDFEFSASPGGLAYTSEITLRPVKPLHSLVIPRRPNRALVQGAEAGTGAPR